MRPGPPPSVCGSLLQPLSEAGATGPQIAVTRAGTAIAVWLFSGLVQAAVRPPGGAWGPAETISSTLDASRSPQVAVDAAGNARAVWGRARNGQMSMQASIRPVETGVWGEPENVTVPPASDFGPTLAVSARGDAIVVSAPRQNLVCRFETRTPKSGLRRRTSRWGATSALTGTPRSGSTPTATP